MVPRLVLIGVILVPSAGFLLWSWRNSRNEMALMRATETTRAADIAKLPVGSVVEVKGRLRCASPVTAESRWMLGLGVFCLIGAIACLGSAYWLARLGF